MSLNKAVIASLSDEIVNLIASILPSTVTISGSSSNFSTSGSGSGWVYDDQGHIVTNFHVIDGMVDPIKVKPAGLPQLVGKVIGYDKANDLAVLQVDHLTGPPLSLRLDPARLGEICIAIGSPLGLQESASLGIVSGVSRQGKGSSGVIIEEMIQTDASVNPGNSGGPLIDSRGKVIGINTMGHGETVNFAVSSEIINDIVPELIAFGESKRASIGVSVAATWHLQNDSLCQVIEVRSVKRAESPLRQGDLIVKVNSTDIKRRIDIRKALYRDTVGKEVSVVVEREGKLLELKVLAN